MSTLYTLKSPFEFNQNVALCFYQCPLNKISPYEKKIMFLFLGFDNKRRVEICQMIFFSAFVIFCSLLFDSSMKLNDFHIFTVEREKRRVKKIYYTHPFDSVRIQTFSSDFF